LIRSESGCLSDPVKGSIIVEVIPEEFLAETIILCADLQGNILEDIELGEDLGQNYKYEWFLGGNPVSNQAIFILDEVPSSNELRLEITDTRGNCVKIFESEIQVFSAPDKVDIEIDGNDFEEGFTITATGNSLMFPNSDYEYQLDNGPWQESNIFRKVHPGLHNITAREINGCGTTTSENFNLVGYPRFFTPNSDGFNDTWKIEGDENIKVLELFIFDRFGQLLKQLNPNGAGWDGSYGGRNLPANDYWFELKYLDRNTGKTSLFKSHFTLKRQKK
jgi:gliding motility-associated-like protein